MTDDLPTPLLPIWDNQGLFSNHYLQHQFPLLPLWPAREADLRQRFERLKELYAAAQVANIINTRNEQQTEDVFIRPVLRDVLGWRYDPQIRASGRAPDYGLFTSDDAYLAAKQDTSYGTQYYSQLTAVAEAKFWGRELNMRDKAGNDLAALADPTAQVVGYLDAAAVRSNFRVVWAILTNGAWWRLFYYRAKSITSNFYQVNVAALCAQDDFASFIYFYGMFSAEAMALDAHGRRWLDDYLEASSRYAQEVSGKLRDVIFGSVFESLAQGLVEARGLPVESAEDKSLMFRATLVLLYRILFVLYAESRDLLPVSDHRGYGQISLRRVCDKLWQALNDGVIFTKVITYYHDALKLIFKIIDSGDPQINMPRYNGGLFAHCAPRDATDPSADTDAARLLADVSIGDLFMAEALKGLVFDTSVPGEKRAYDYSSLDVQHLGTIYEGLLDFTIEIAREPMLAVPEDGTVKWKPVRLASAAERAAAEATRQPGQVMLLNTRGERKSSGAYYTPQAMVEYIVQRTVVPRVEEVLRDAEAFWRNGGPGAHNPTAFSLRLFDISVCDPAMGSGHFLVHAVDVIADMINTWHGAHPDSPLTAFLDGQRGELLRAVAELGVHIDNDKLENRHLIRRMVLKQCIFGVDINPMAVELAKLSLWLHSFTVGAPLSFLDHHIKCGNSLVGAHDFSQVVAVGSKTWNDVLQAMQFMLAIDRLGDLTYAQVAESKRTYDECREKLLVALNRAHAVTAMYFDDELAQNVYVFRGVLNAIGKRHRDLLRDAAADAAYGASLVEEADGAVGEPQSISDALHRVLACAERFRFFHWQLEFPDIFVARDGSGFAPDAGFDCVIGNPPWERIKLQETEFFAGRDADIAAAPTAAKRKELIERLPKTNPVLAAAYQDALDYVSRTMNYIRACKQFPLLGKGDLNLYALMLERAMALTKPTGRTGFLTPSGIATDNTNKEFFQTIVAQRRLEEFIDFENKKVFFPDVDSRFKFAISIIGGRARQCPAARCAFFIHNMQELDDPQRVFELTAEDFALLNPNTRTCPIFRTRRDAELTKAIYRRVPILINESNGEAGNPWRIRLFTMFHMANDSALFKTAKELERNGFWRAADHVWQKGKEQYCTLYEAKMCWFYDHRFASCFATGSRLINKQASDSTPTEKKRDPAFTVEPRYFVPRAEIDKALAQYEHAFLMGWRNITCVTNERTLVPVLIPRLGAGHSLQFIHTPSENSCVLYANLCSYAVDFIVRQKMTGNNLVYFVLRQLPVLPPSAYDQPFHGADMKALISERVLKLVYTANDMQGFAREMGYDGPPFVWDDDERLHLRCQLDALYFHLYGLDREEITYVMDTFPIVRDNDLAQYGTYRTRDLILQYYNAYAAGDVSAQVKEKPARSKT